jgi:predicted short-subunit dehydrogenase-like oxidoreductase (DUF2520 family)
VVIVGRGRVGRSLAAALADGRVARRADVLGREPRGPAPGTLIFCVPDDALEEAACAWADALGPASEARATEELPAARVALHTSGVHAASALEPLRGAGYALAAWHPLTVVDRPDPEALLGVTWGLEGDESAMARAGSLSADLDGRVLHVAPDEHARYHAAAVFASNLLVACLSAAAAELSEAVEEEADVTDLLPLARAALEAVGREGLRGGLTGPVARGDAGTVRRHLQALDGRRRELYRELARELVQLVSRDLPPGGLAALESALDEEERR